MSATASDRRAQIEQQILALLGDDAPLDGLLERVVTELQSRIPHFTGVYIYWLEAGDVLRLRAFRGRPTEHVRIPVGQGVCGRAAREKQTVVVDDVTADPAYLACSLETRSEIVVPVMRGGTVLGEIDIDSDVPAAFTTQDRAFLEKLATLIGARGNP
jgi:GAF domain-containing protein